MQCSGMEILNHSTVRLEQLYGVLPSLAHLDDTLKERLVIEGIVQLYKQMSASVFCA